MSLIELFFRQHNPPRVLSKTIDPAEAMTCTPTSTGQCPLLSLPPELRSQIYEYIIGSRVVHVRMNWVGIFSPTGFSYSCFNDIQPLLESSARDLLGKAVPFGTDVTTLTRVCRQMHQDTSVLPFKLWVWTFEDAFTLDQFVTAKGLGVIPLRQKEAIRRVAVAPPGPHRSHEKVLQSMQEVLLISFTQPAIAHQTEGSSPMPRRGMFRLRRDPFTDTWLRND